MSEVPTHALSNSFARWSIHWLTGSPIEKEKERNERVMNGRWMIAVTRQEANMCRQSLEKYVKMMKARRPGEVVAKIVDIAF